MEQAVDENTVPTELNGNAGPVTNGTDPNIALWQKWRDTDDPKILEQLMQLFVPVCKAQARKLAKTSEQNEDLYAEGMIGALQCLPRFDPERDAGLKTFVNYRIYGAMLDYLRAQSNQKGLTREIYETRGKMQEIRQKADGPLTNDEITEELKGLGYSLGRIKRAMLWRPDLNIDDPVGEDGLTLGDAIPSDIASPDDEITEKQNSDVLSQLIDSLPERQAQALRLYYSSELTMAEIGKRMNVTESRICQLHARAITTLRRKMGSAYEGKAIGGGLSNSGEKPMTMKGVFKTKEFEDWFRKLFIARGVHAYKAMLHYLQKDWKLAKIGRTVAGKNGITNCLKQAFKRTRVSQEILAGKDDQRIEISAPEVRKQVRQIVLRNYQREKGLFAQLGQTDLAKMHMGTIEGGGFPDRLESMKSNLADLFKEARLLGLNVNGEKISIEFLQVNGSKKKQAVIKIPVSEAAL